MLLGINFSLNLLYKVALNIMCRSLVMREKRDARIKRICPEKVTLNCFLYIRTLGQQCDVIR